MGYNPQESLENTINTMGTLLGVLPIVPWMKVQEAAWKYRERLMTFMETYGSLTMCSYLKCIFTKS